MDGLCARFCRDKSRAMAREEQEQCQNTLLGRRGVPATGLHVHARGVVRNADSMRAYGGGNNTWSISQSASRTRGCQSRAVPKGGVVEVDVPTDAHRRPNVDCRSCQAGGRRDTTLGPQAVYLVLSTTAQWPALNKSRGDRGPCCTCQTASPASSASPAASSCWVGLLGLLGSGVGGVAQCIMTLPIWRGRSGAAR
jgi:hypothetical protein